MNFDIGVDLSSIFFQNVKIAEDDDFKCFRKINSSPTLNYSAIQTILSFLKSHKNFSLIILLMELIIHPLSILIINKPNLADNR